MLGLVADLHGSNQLQSKAQAQAALKEAEGFDEGASLTSLPVELLEKITSYLDNQTLFSLCKLSRQLNHICTHGILKLNKVSSGFTDPSGNGWLVSRRASSELVPKLYAMLWLNCLTSITFYFNPDIKRLVFETRGLTDLIRRVGGDIERLELDFGVVDKWAVELSKKETGKRNSVGIDSEDERDALRLELDFGVVDKWAVELLKKETGKGIVLGLMVRTKEMHRWMR
ncbi:hypothetical protein AN958_01055 [Leucoagaricus sp. SymC.cos]|nr:hypothetical protein AN958_01055 [Leucoagaricus sp. SymC.cos]